MKSFDKFVGLSGLPRSGSTLLSSILSQNPSIHSEGTSPVCQLMWDTLCSCINSCSQQLTANDKMHKINDFMRYIPHIYYQGISEPIVIDKCRVWPIENNFKIFKQSIDTNPKIVVLYRPVIEIVSSFVNLQRMNGVEPDDEYYQKLLYKEDGAILIYPLKGVKWSRMNNQNSNFLFISYDELVEDTQKVIKQVYDFYEIGYFQHNLNNIITKYIENDDAYEPQLKGLHSVRSSISKRDYAVTLPDRIIERCNELQKELDELY